MGFYSKVIFPRICDWLLSQENVAKHRKELLKNAHGDLLEIGFGMGLNLAWYPDSVRMLKTVDPILE